MRLFVWSIARRLAQDLSYGIPAEKLGISHGRSSKDGYHIYRVPPTISLGFPLLKICGSPSHSALPRDVDWQVLDTRLLNRLWVELHQRQYFLRHAHFDGEPQLAGFKRVRRTGPAPCGCDCRGACRHAPPRAPAKPARRAARHRCVAADRGAVARAAHADRTGARGGDESVPFLAHLSRRGGHDALSIRSAHASPPRCRGFAPLERADLDHRF